MYRSNHITMFAIPSNLLTQLFQTHHDLPEDPQAWYRTPVDFIRGPRWQIGIHWAYYTRWLEILCVPLYSRPIKSKLWDPFPSDEWLPAENGPILLFFSFIPVGFTIWFFAGWEFFFFFCNTYRADPLEGMRQLPRHIRGVWLYVLLYRNIQVAQGEDGFRQALSVCGNFAVSQRRKKR